jgi:hypothetical protein
VIVPNGSIQELGVVYRVARYLKIPTVTYEFSDQRQRIWVAQNSEVMRQETGGMWEATKDVPLSEDQMNRMKSLMMARWLWIAARRPPAVPAARDLGLNWGQGPCNPSRSGGDPTARGDHANPGRGNVGADLSAGLS